MSTMPVVRARGIRKVYGMGGEDVHALRGIDLDILRSEYVSIMGPSGCGKSTLFNMIGGLDKPTDGRVLIDGVDIAQLSTYELAWLRCCKIGYIFQTFNLIGALTALENVSMPMVFMGKRSDEVREKAAHLLRMVGLGERLGHKPSQLSGGQQQRVAIARALANSPSIVLADEPTGNLDSKTGTEIINLLYELKDKEGVTVISATHDRKMLKASDRVVHLDDGSITTMESGDDFAAQLAREDGNLP